MLHLCFLIPKESKFSSFPCLFQSLSTMSLFPYPSLFSPFTITSRTRNMGKPQSPSAFHLPPLQHVPKLQVLHTLITELPDLRAKETLTDPRVCLGLQPLPSLLRTAPELFCSPEKHTKPAGLGCYSGGPRRKTEMKREKKITRGWREITFYSGV